MEFLKVLLQMVVTVVIVIFAYNVLKVYVFDKIKINKWIILTIAALVFVVPNLLLPKLMQNNSLLALLQTIVFLILFLWFMDMTKLGKVNAASKDNKNNTVMRAKAKPNRVNNNDMEVINVNNKGKRRKK